MVVVPPFPLVKVRPPVVTVPDTVKLLPIVTFPLFATSNIVSKVAGPPVFSFVLLSVEVRLISATCENDVKFGTFKLFTVLERVPTAESNVK